MKFFKKIFILLTLFVTFVSAEFSTYEEAFQALTKKWNEIVENLNNWVYEIWVAEGSLDNTYQKDGYSKFEEYGIKTIYNNIKTKIWKLDKWRNVISSKFNELYTWLQATDKAYYTIAKNEAHNTLKETYKKVIKDYPYYSWALSLYYRKLDNDLDFASEVWWKFPDFGTGEESSSVGTGLAKAKVKAENILLQLDKDGDYKQAKLDMNDAFIISSLDLEQVKLIQDEASKSKRKVTVFLDLTNSFDDKGNAIIYKISLGKITKQDWIQELKDIYTELLAKYPQFPKTCERMYNQYSIKLQNLGVQDVSSETAETQKKLDNTVLKLFWTLEKKYSKTPEKYKNQLRGLAAKFSAGKYAKSNEWRYIVKRLAFEAQSVGNYKQYISENLQWYFSLNSATTNKAWGYYRMKVSNAFYTSGVVGKWLKLDGENSGLKIYKSITYSKNEYFVPSKTSTSTTTSTSLSGEVLSGDATNGTITWEATVIQDKIYYNEKYDLSIKHPWDWIDTTSVISSELKWNTNGEIVYIIAKEWVGDTDDEKKKSTVSLSIWIWDNLWLDLKTYTEQSILSIKDLLKWDIKEEKDITIGGASAHKVVYNAVKDGIQFTLAQAWLLKDDKAYIITFANYPEGYDNFSAKIDEVISTFKFGNQTEATVQSLKIMEGEVLSGETATEVGSWDLFSWVLLDNANLKDISLSFWMKISDISTGNKIVTIHGWKGAEEVFTLFLTSNGTFNIKLDDASNSIIAWNTKIEANTWYHISLIYDQKWNLVKTYVNWVNDIYSVVADLNIENPSISMWNYYQGSDEKLNTTLNIDEVYLHFVPINVNTLQMLYRKK